MTAWTTADIPDQRGRTVVVTGATSGLGRETSLALAGAGARVLLAARNPAKAERTRSEVAAVATAAEPEVVALDLTDLASVRDAAAAIADRAPRLDVLMNNAGVMALPYGTTVDGFESQLGTNHLGPFALTLLTLPALLAADDPRVVTTTSLMHRPGHIRWDDLNGRRKYRRWPAYCQSKLANLLFTFELDRRARAGKTALRSVGAHPGYAATHLQAAGPEMAGNRVGAGVMDAANAVFAQSASAGALPQLYGATMPDVRGGEVFGPSGLFESRGAPTRVRASARARDEDDAARLWDVSEDLTGVGFTFPVPPSSTGRPR